MKCLIITATALTSIVSLLAMETNTPSQCDLSEFYAHINNSLRSKQQDGIIDEGELILFEPAEKNVAPRRIVKFRPGKPLKKIIK